MEVGSETQKMLDELSRRGPAGPKDVALEIGKMMLEDRKLGYAEALTALTILFAAIICHVASKSPNPDKAINSGVYTLAKAALQSIEHMRSKHED